MCLLRRRNFRDLDPKTRRIWACGNLCVFASLGLTLYGSSFEHRHRAAFEVLRGFLLGMALVFLLWSGRRMRCADNCA
jgi:hypothetical protein